MVGFWNKFTERFFDGGISNASHGATDFKVVPRHTLATLVQRLRPHIGNDPHALGTEMSPGPSGWGLARYWGPGPCQSRTRAVGPGGRPGGPQPTLSQLEVDSRMLTQARIIIMRWPSIEAMKAWVSCGPGPGLGLGCQDWHRHGPWWKAKPWLRLARDVTQAWKSRSGMNNRYWSVGRQPGPRWPGSHGDSSKERPG